KSSRTISQARGPRIPSVAIAARPGGVKQTTTVPASGVASARRAEAIPAASPREELRFTAAPPRTGGCLPRSFLANIGPQRQERQRYEAHRLRSNRLHDGEKP